MVRLDARLKEIRELYVDRGKYFVINRGRQYGKTTTLRALAEYLKEGYIVFSMDFQLMSTACFADERIFGIKLYCLTISLAVKPDCITLTGSIA